MKSTTQNVNLTRNTGQQNKQRPDIRDDMDHREGEENLKKGDDITHNKKDTKREHLKKK
jgi:hypothetical protein